MKNSHPKWIYRFGPHLTEGHAGLSDLLGGKGANLAEMSRLHLPVPPGFTLTTELCNFYYTKNRSLPEGLKEQVDIAISWLEKDLGMGFGSSEKPLLLSVRSGAPTSMPGMMDTILNLGLNEKTLQGLIKESNDPRFAYDSYRRFIQMYSSVVLDIDHGIFEDILEHFKQSKGYFDDNALTANDLSFIIKEYKAKIQHILGISFPETVSEQLWGAIHAVLNSWMSARAVTYRRLNRISEAQGTAVTVQAMVFGNCGEDCATGVAFTRDPSNGEPYFFGEYLINAQGEDVVAGIRTPHSITIRGKEKLGSTELSMEEKMPDAFQALSKLYHTLEQHYKDMQDIEFTIQHNKLWILQTRSGKRTIHAAIRIAVDMVKEGLITKEEALLHIDPYALDQLLHPMLDPKAKKQILDKGLPASPGAACGIVVFNSADAELRTHNDEKVILVRIETSPEDIHGMYLAEGILTARGGMTSHAAVVARGMGKPCVSGAGSIHIDYAKKQLITGGRIIEEGEYITIDGSSGEIFYDKVPMIQPQMSEEFTILMQWADEISRMKVRSNADTPQDALISRNFGAEGIGLCRTEHMFFDNIRLVAMREMILADDTEGREKALQKLLPYQRKDFLDIFRIMAGLPVTVRLLDPPLHEFLPHSESEMQAVADEASISLEKIQKRASSLKELNPMLGHRGCRLGISYPEIYAMQARAMFEALAILEQETAVLLEIMVPLIMGVREFSLIKEIIKKEAAKVEEKHNITLYYKIGTMIELPRAALKAGEIAEEAEFFSFGTNDLTQTTLGISRDDAFSFINNYVDHKILPRDPFAHIDKEGVGELVTIACMRGRSTNPALKLGICGEHGGNPESIEFFDAIGLDYVSCSPYRVPIAKLATAHAAILHKKHKT